MNSKGGSDEMGASKDTERNEAGRESGEKKSGLKDLLRKKLKPVHREIIAPPGE